jgi:hypothetical protein
LSHYAKKQQFAEKGPGFSLSFLEGDWKRTVEGSEDAPRRLPRCSPIPACCSLMLSTLRAACRSAGLARSHFSSFICGVSALSSLLLSSRARCSLGRLPAPPLFPSPLSRSSPLQVSDARLTLSSSRFFQRLCPVQWRSLPLPPLPPLQSSLPCRTALSACRPKGQRRLSSRQRLALSCSRP